MKSITLKKLELTNYRNIEHATYEFNGDSKIIGENRIGKTNTLEAINFLLTGTLLNGSSDIAQIKPLNDTKLVVKVKGTFDVGGKELTLQKEYGEEWVKTRGSEELTLKGHFTTYYYNDVKQSSQKDYNFMLNQDLGITPFSFAKLDVNQLLTNPLYLGELCNTKDWTEVRKVINDIVGNVEDEQVFNFVPETIAIKPLMEQCGGRVEQVKKAISDEITTYKEEIIKDDAKIEMLKSAQRPSESAVELAQIRIKECENEISRLESSNPITQVKAQMQSEIAEVSEQIFKIKDQRLKDYSNPKEELYSELQKKMRAYDRALLDVSSTQSKIDTENYTISHREEDKRIKETEKARLLEKYKALKLDEDSIVVDDHCSLCHAPLSKKRMQELKDEIIAKNDSERAVIKEQGQRVAYEIKSIADDIVEHKSNIRSLECSLKMYQDNVDKLKEEVDIAQHNYDSCQTTDNTIDEELSALEVKKAKLVEEYKKVIQDEQIASSNISHKVYELKGQIESHQEVLNELKLYEKQQSQLGNIEQERKQHIKNLVKSEQQKDLLAKFNIAKLNLIDSNVAKIFGGIRFQLLKQNINGGFDSVCKPYIYNVENDSSTSTLWNSGSKSERIVTGIAILEKIREHYKLPVLPILFDEGGEISKTTIESRIKTDAQIICVKVEDGIITPIVLPLR